MCTAAIALQPPKRDWTEPLGLSVTEREATLTVPLGADPKHAASTVAHLLAEGWVETDSWISAEGDDIVTFERNLVAEYQKEIG